MPRNPDRPSTLRRSVAASTPLLAVVGATDVVVERVRDTTSTAAARAEKVQAGLEDALSTYRIELVKGLEAAQAEVAKTVAAYSEGLDRRTVQAKVARNVRETVQQVPATIQQTIQQTVQQTVQQVPALAVSRALEVVGQVETGYTDLAVRGKLLVERVRRQGPTQDLVDQGRATLTRTRAAVTTARRAVDDTTAAARSAVTIGRREAAETVTEVGRTVEESVEQSVEKTEQVVAARTSGTRSTARRTASTARKGTAATRKAAADAAASAGAAAGKAEDAAEAAADEVGD